MSRQATSSTHRYEQRGFVAPPSWTTVPSQTSVIGQGQSSHRTPGQRAPAGQPHYNALRSTTAPTMGHSSPYLGANSSSMRYPPVPHPETPSYPPPISRRCIGLPDVTGAREQIKLNPTLAYSDTLRPYGGWNVVSPPFVDEGCHVCPPATDPGVKSMTIILPSGQPIVVHSSEKHGVVTVRDVLYMIGQATQNPSMSTGARPPPPPTQRRENGDPLCLCELGSSPIILLRSRYMRAGLTSHPSDSMSGTWHLRIT